MKILYQTEDGVQYDSKEVAVNHERELIEKQKERNAIAQMLPAIKQWREGLSRPTPAYIGHGQAYYEREVDELIARYVLKLQKRKRVVRELNRATAVHKRTLKK